jgi:hypothetical protein
MRNKLFLIMTALLLMPSLNSWAAELKSSPFVVYDPQNNRYIVSYTKKLGTPLPYNIYGIIENAEGSDLGSAFQIGGTTNSEKYVNSVIAHEDVNNKNLVVWWYNVLFSYELEGRLVDSNGTPSGGIVDITSPANQSLGSPSVAYDNVNQKFLVVWEQSGVIGGYNIYGYILNYDGSLKTGPFTISNANNYERYPVVVYDSKDRKFLVAWYDHPAGVNDPDIFGQFVTVDSDGKYSLVGNNFSIADQIVVAEQTNIALAYDAITNKFLLAWHDGRNLASTQIDIYGQFVNGDGTPSGENFVISNALQGQIMPFAIYDSENERFLVTWIDGRNVPTKDIYGQFINTDKTFEGSNFGIIMNVYGYNIPVAAYNPYCSNFLMPYVTTEKDIHFHVIGPCDSTPPTVSSVTPADGTMNVAVAAPITATFSEAMKESTINTNTITMSGDVTGTVTYDAATNTATFKTSSPLAYDTNYTMTVTNGVKDSMGHNMSSDYKWSFTTTAAPPAGGGERGGEIPPPEGGGGGGGGEGGGGGGGGCGCSLIINASR